MIPALARDHHVITFDLLGHGGSEKPRDGYSMEEQAAAWAPRSTASASQGALIGHSMGGDVATALVERAVRWSPRS